jgi:hypothetical protein
VAALLYRADYRPRLHYFLLLCFCDFVVIVFPHGLSSVPTLLYSLRHCQILLPIENIGIRMTRKENMKDEG